MRDYSATFGDRVRFVPLKGTGLCAPTLLERMSGVIKYATPHRHNACAHAQQTLTFVLLSDQAAVDNAWTEGRLVEPMTVVVLGWSPWCLIVHHDLTTDLWLCWVSI